MKTPLAGFIVATQSRSRRGSSRGFPNADQWLARYPETSPTSWHCDWCGRGPTADAAVLPMPIVGEDRGR